MCKQPINDPREKALNHCHMSRKFLNAAFYTKSTAYLAKPHNRRYSSLSAGEFAMRCHTLSIFLYKELVEDPTSSTGDLLRGFRYG